MRQRTAAKLPAVMAGLDPTILLRRGAKPEPDDLGSWKWEPPANGSLPWGEAKGWPAVPSATLADGRSGDLAELRGRAGEQGGAAGFSRCEDYPTPVLLNLRYQPGLLRLRTYVSACMQAARFTAFPKITALRCRK